MQDNKSVFSYKIDHLGQATEFSFPFKNNLQPPHETAYGKIISFYGIFISQKLPCLSTTLYVCPEDKS